MFKRKRQERCEVVGCDQPATYFQLVECDAARTSAARVTMPGRATIASVCEEHSRTERASDFSIANSRQVMAARRARP
jgi:hypothetical protein